MARFEGTAGPSIFAVGETVRRDPGKKVGTGLVIGGLMVGGAPASAASYAITAYTAYDTITPLRPAISTKMFGSYKGEEYKFALGFGYEEHLSAKHHPATAWFMRRHRYVWGRKSPWEAVQIPTFGFGWGSEIVQTESSSSSYQQNGGSSGQQKKTGPPLAGGPPIIPPAPGRGIGRNTAGGTKRAPRPRRDAPYCWVHKKFHYCRITSKR
jgi:hypothetical protein